MEIELGTEILRTNGVIVLSCFPNYCLEDTRNQGGIV